MRRYWYRFILLFIMAGLMSLLYWGWCYLRKPTTLPFHQVRLIYPLQHIDTKQISQLAWDHIEGGFFSLNVEELKKALQHQPWITQVSIRREWPDTLALSIQEKHPEARWGALGVLSSEGEVFYPTPKSIPNDLPTIIAPERQRKKILTNFQKLSDDLQLLGLGVKILTVTPRGIYQLTLSNGIPVMIGRDNVLQRFRRFVDLYSQVIAGKEREVINVDLRYPNGFAVQWKKHHR